MPTSQVPGRADANRPPTLPDPRLARELLVQRLCALPPGGVAILVAPSGYGLTTLLGMVAAATPEPVVWVSPRRDADPVALLCSCMRDELVASGLVLPEPPVLEPGDLAGWRAYLTELVAIAAARPPVLLVIDDLPQDAGLEAAIQDLVDDLPTSLRLVLRARVMPQLDFTRPLGAGRLLLLGRADLALGRDESEAFIAMAAPELPAGSARALAAVADGWIAALRAGISAAGRTDSDPAEWLLGPGLELLFGPVLRRLEPEDRELLVRCSVLDILDPQACDAMLSRSDSAERLARLADGLLLDRVTQAGPAYGASSLFGEFLRRKLAERGRAAEQDAHEAAGRWLAQQGHIEDAISHLLDCGQMDLAREVLTDHVGALLDSGRSSRVRAWYRKTPELAVPDDQLHLLAAGWSELLAGDVRAASRHLTELEQAAAEGVTVRVGGAVPTELGIHWLATEALNLRAYIEAWMGQTAQASRHLAQVRERQGYAWTRMAHQSAAFHQVRVELWGGDIGRAREHLRALSRRSGTRQLYRLVSLPSLGAWLAAEEGRAYRACFLADGALEAAATHGTVGAVGDCDARLARARALVDLGDLAAADDEAIRVATTARAVGHVSLMALAALARARVLAARGQHTGADQQIEQARLSLRRHGVASPLEARIAGVEVEVAIEAGDRGRARTLVQRLVPGRDRDFLMMRILTMGGAVRESDGMAHLRRVRPESPREVADARLLMVAVTAATRRPEAVMHLREAAGVAQANGLLRVLCGRSEEVQALAEQVAGEGADPAVGSLLPAPHAPQEPEPRPVAGLSRGELDLLARLSRVQGNRELAQELGITTNTLKTRLRRLYAKLGVHDRHSALRAVGLRDREG